jgi:polysaccharide biosynthesis protein PslG
MASPEYGLDVHMWWDPWAAVRRDWHLVRDGGFGWVKQRVAWADVEGAGPGRYEWVASDRIVDDAEQAGVNLLFRVDHPPVWAVTPGTEYAISSSPISLEAFESFCSVLAARYRGRVRGYQIWNEPNLAREWEGHPPDPAEYVRLLQTCYIAIKQADPDALVISAGLAPTGSSSPEAMPDEAYLVGMYEAGAGPYFDLLGLNAPGYKAPPEVAPEDAADPTKGYGGHSFFCFRHVETMRAIMVRYGDAHKQVAILEFGWHTNDSLDHPDYAWFAVTPEEQAAYLVRALQYAEAHWAPWIGPMFVWNLPDPTWTPENEEFWWAIADPFWWGFSEGDDVALWSGGALRPAYDALKEMLHNR